MYPQLSPNSLGFSVSYEFESESHKFNPAFIIFPIQNFFKHSFWSMYNLKILKTLKVFGL